MSAPPAATAAGDDPDDGRDPGGRAQQAAARATERRRLDLWAPEHPDRDRAVDWLVQSVVDPDGDGADAAYTIGLRRYGLPELYVEARPTFGDDPGIDWGLSPRDQTDLLNELALRLLDGTAGQGSVWFESYDAGLTSARFLLGGPVPARGLAARQLADDEPALLVQFSLHRPDCGPLTAVSDPTALMIDGWTRDVRQQTDRLRTVSHTIGMRAPAVPPGWRMPTGTLLGDRVDVDPDQPFGPLHWLVAARAEQLTIADPATLAEFITRAGRATRAGATAGMARAVLMTQARSHGRQQAVHLADQSGHLVLDQIAGRSRVTRRWRDACDLLGAPTRAGWKREFEAACRETARDWIGVTLATEAMADLLTDQHLALGRGPWAWAVQPDSPPGRFWIAPPALVQQVVALFANRTAADLLELLDRFSGGDRRMLAEAADLLLGCRTTGAGSAPPGTVLVPVEATDQLHPDEAFGCEEVAAMVLAVLAVPDRIALGPGRAVTGLVRPWL